MISYLQGRLRLLKKNSEILAFLSSTFIYEAIWMKIYMNANIIKTQFKKKVYLTVQLRSHKVI